MAANVPDFTDDNFEQEVMKSEIPVVVDLWADWCAPCRAIAPALDELVNESGGAIGLAKVNVDEQPGLAARYGIRSIPTILFMKGGKVLDQVIGAVPKTQLRKKLDAIG